MLRKKIPKCTLKRTQLKTVYVVCPFVLFQVHTEIQTHIHLWFSEFKSINPELNQPWTFIGRTDSEAEAPKLCLAIWCKEPTHWKGPWCWERLRGWQRMSWIASPTQWIWIWANSGRQWRGAWHAAIRARIAKNQTQLSDRMTITKTDNSSCFCEGNWRTSAQERERHLFFTTHTFRHFLKCCVLCLDYLFEMNKYVIF